VFAQKRGRAYDVRDATGSSTLHQVQLGVGVAVLRPGGWGDEEGVGEVVAQDGRVHAGLDVGHVNHGTGPKAVTVENLERGKSGQHLLSCASERGS